MLFCHRKFCTRKRATRNRKPQLNKISQRNASDYLKHCRSQFSHDSCEFLHQRKLISEGKLRIHPTTHTSAQAAMLTSWAWYPRLCFFREGRETGNSIITIKLIITPNRSPWTRLFKSILLCFFEPEWGWSERQNETTMSRKTNGDQRPSLRCRRKFYPLYNKPTVVRRLRRRVPASVSVLCYYYHPGTR